MFHYIRVALPALLLVACGGSPSSTPSNPVTPTPTVSSVTVNGSAPALDETTQFTATATLSNATTQDVTAQATWHSSDAGVATVSSTGVVRSVAAGEVDIAATYSGVSGSKHVTVAAPTRTHSVSGVITEDSTGRPIIEQAEAQVMDGENAGKVGRAEANGAYTIADLTAGTFTLRARATGYESRDHQVAIDTADVRVDFALRRLALPCAYTATTSAPDVVPWSGGQFSITITRTSGTCAWAASTDASWITFPGAVSGNGSAVITFTVGQGGLLTSYGSITISWNGGSARIRVTQGPRPDWECRPVGLSKGPEDFDRVPSAGGTLTVLASAPADPPIWSSACAATVSSYLPWISGGGRVVTFATFTFTVAANPAPGTARTGSIVLTGPGGTATLTVTQR